MSFMRAVILDPHDGIAEIQERQLALAAAIEREIQRAAMELSLGQDRETRSAAWDRLVWLKAQQSATTVKQIEERKGLA